MSDPHATSPAPGGEPCLSVIMPVHNEADFLEEILRRVAAQSVVGEIIVVDDASSDGSAELVERLVASELPQVRLIRQSPNQGKGSAVRRGFEHVTHEYVVIQDADLEYWPEDYPALLEPMQAGHADVVFGDRFHKGRPEHMRPLYYAANRFLSWVFNTRNRTNVLDMETCYKVFRSKYLPYVTSTENRFCFDPELAAELIRLGARVANVPITYRARTREEGKKIGWKDGVAQLIVILKGPPGRKLLPE